MSATAVPNLATTQCLKWGILGASLHISTLRLRPDNHGWRIVSVWGLFLFATFFATSRSSGAWPAAAKTFEISTAFLSGFFTSTILYRLYFSPIRKFPGPWQAAVTSFYRARLAIKSNIRLFTEIKALHEQYGDYVRTGPREVSILNPNAIPILYGARSQCRRGPWYDHDMMPQEEDKSVFLLRDPAIHSWRRRILDRGFSTLADYEPRIQNVVDALIKALQERSGTTINLTDWISYFTFDAMGRVAYNQDFGMLERGEGTVVMDGRSTSIQTLHEMIKLFGVLSVTPWLIRMIIQMNLSSQLAAFHQWCHDTMKHKQQTFDPATSTPTDMASWLVHSAHNPPDASKRQNQASLESDSVLLIIAGSDTTSSAIGNALFYLTRDRARFAKLRRLLDALPHDGDGNHSRSRSRSPRALASCRYLDAVINETLRLKPPVCQGLVRETPDTGITIPAHHNDTASSSSSSSSSSFSKKDVFIPPGTLVTVPTWALQRDKRFWGPDADVFRPERFEEEEGLEDGAAGGIDTTAEGTPFMPFSRGAYACPGKQVAWIEMRAVVAAVVTEFDLELADGQGERAFDEGCLDTFTLTNPELRVVMKRRKRED